MPEMTRTEIEALLTDVTDTDPSGAWSQKAIRNLHVAALDLARQLLDALDLIEAWKTETLHHNEIAKGYQRELEARRTDHVALLDALLPFWDQCQRGETENPERYQATYLALDDVLRRLL